MGKENERWDRKVLILLFGNQEKWPFGMKPLIESLSDRKKT